MTMSLKQKIKKFYYSRIVKPIIFNSRLGRRTMFGYADSGINFDHIYNNKAKGYNKLGETVDRILLNLPACKATRHRKNRIVEILTKEIQNNSKNGIKTRIVDLASGPARYIVDAITDKLINNTEVLCFDANEHSLEYGKKIARGKQMLFKKTNILKIGGPHYKRISEVKDWRPNLVVCSGLYEYLEDEEVKSSFKKVMEFLDKDGLLLFVTQKSNPNKKLIENVGVTSSGKKWVLNYRTPSILKKWMQENRFKNIEFEIDPWGMYEFFKGRK